MTTFHAILIDETGREFHAYTEAPNASEAYDDLQGDYPESNVVRVGILGDAAPIEPTDECARLRNLIAEIRGRLFCVIYVLDATRREGGNVDAAPLLRDLADHAAAAMKDDDNA